MCALLLGITISNKHELTFIAGVVKIFNANAAKPGVKREWLSRWTRNNASDMLKYLRRILFQPTVPTEFYSYRCYPQERIK